MVYKDPQPAHRGSSEGIRVAQVSSSLFPLSLRRKIGLVLRDGSDGRRADDVSPRPMTSVVAMVDTATFQGVNHFRRQAWVEVEPPMCLVVALLGHSLSNSLGRTLGTGQDETHGKHRSPWMRTHDYKAMDGTQSTIMSVFRIQAGTWVRRTNRTGVTEATNAQVH